MNLNNKKLTSISLGAIIHSELELDVKAAQHTGKCISYKLSDQELEKYKILVINKLKRY